MKHIALLILLNFFPATPATWLQDFNQGKEVASRENKHILLNFSGSDWCLPCIRLRKDIFESSEFGAYAAQLVLVNVDFPRQKKNKPTAEQVKKNDVLAERYNPEGTFPLTLLLDAEGKEIKRWVGEVGDATMFVNEIRNACTAGK